MPSQTIALLVEFGVHPRRLGVDRLFSERSMQWSGFAASTSPTPAVAHIGRPALDIALLELALRAGASLHGLGDGRLDQFRQRQQEENCLVLDATGRSAITAARRIAPKRPIVARLLHLAMRPSLRSTGLMIAAGPDGYAYRLANAATLTIGIVGRNDFVRGDGREVVARIADFAPWLVEGVSGEDLQAGASGPASAQCSFGDDAITAIGDAAFARDALASQGLATGFSDALKAVAQPEQRACAFASSGRRRSRCIVRTRRRADRKQRVPIIKTLDRIRAIPVRDGAARDIGDVRAGRRRELAYSTLPIFFTAAISRALSSATNFENSGASM